MELFKTPADALLFALRFSTQQYAASPMARLMRQGISAGGSGKGLVALDGAAQAGLILSKLEKMNALERACIVARYTTRTEHCSCCGADKPTDDYKGAIITLADWAEQFISATGSVRRIRYAIVQEYYERRRALSAEAAKINVPKRTAYDQKDKIWPHLADIDKRAQEVIGDMLHDLCGELAEGA